MPKGHSMSVEQNVEVITGAVRALNARDWDAYGAAFSESVIVHAPGLTEPATGRAARVQYVQGIIDAFPNGFIEITRTFGRGDLLCVELAFEGTHEGPLPGPDGTLIPPTNRTVQFPYCLVLQWHAGVVVEVHEYFDFLAIFKQLGVL